MWKKKFSEFHKEKEITENLTLKELLNRVKEIPKENFLKKNGVYLIFLVCLALMYIHNNFSVESLQKKHLNLTREIKDLKYEAITTSSELMKKSRQSEVLRKVQENNLGLEELKTQPKVIKVK
jgi:hypothetical protein